MIGIKCIMMIRIRAEGGRGQEREGGRGREGAGERGW